MTNSFRSSVRGVLRIGAACLVCSVAPLPVHAQRSQLELVEDAFRRVQQLTGPSPVECGRHLRPGYQNVPTRDLLDEMLRCALNATSSKTPFWLLIQNLTFDSWGASGLAAGPDGVLRRFQHRSDPYSSAPPITFRPCDNPDLQINSDGWAVVICDERQELGRQEQANHRVKPTAAGASSP